jgi:hypothetical protein
MALSGVTVLTLSVDTIVTTRHASKFSFVHIQVDDVKQICRPNGARGD